MNVKHTARASSVVMGIGMGMGMSLLISLLGAMILAWLMACGKIAESGIGYGCMVILFLSAWLGTELAWHKVKHRHLMVNSVTAAGYFLVLFLIGLGLGGGMEIAWTTVIMIGLGGAVGFLPQLLGWGSGGRKRNKRRSR